VMRPISYHGGTDTLLYEVRECGRTGRSTLVYPVSLFDPMWVTVCDESVIKIKAG
jgi:hypothetical protein